MLDKSVIKRLIVEYQQNARVKKLLPRQHIFDNYSNYVLIGIRRAGKSYLLFQDIQQKIASGTFSSEGFVYLNFEDERLSNVHAQELVLILDCYNELYPESHPWVYLDEIQLVD